MANRRVIVASIVVSRLFPLGQRLLGLPLFSAAGIYLIVRAQLEWFDQPLLSTRETFLKACAGIFLVFTQGWTSRRTDWQPALDEIVPTQHLLATLRWPLALVGLVICSAAAWLGIQREQWITLPLAGLWLPGMGLLLGARLPGDHWRYWLARIRRHPLPEPASLDWRVFSPVVKWLVALLGIRLCLYAGWRADLKDTHGLYLLKLWGVGVGLVIFGLVPTPVLRRWIGMVAMSFRQHWLEWMVVLVLFSAALAVRWAWLETAPYIQSDDEAAFAIQAADFQNVSRFRDNPFRYDSWQGHPMLYHITQLAAINTFGQTVKAARVPSAIMGALTIPAVYLMARRMFNWRVALVAAVFMTTFPVHVHFSRLGLNQVGDPLFATLTFAFLARALRTGDEMEFALVGLSLGLSQYFYAASRIVPLLAVAFIGCYAITNPRWVLRRGDSVVIMAIVAGVVIFPNVYSVHQDKERPFAPRLAHVAIFETGDVQAAATRENLRYYWEVQFARAFGAYVHRVDKDMGFYGQHGPVNGWYGGIAFMIGVGLCLRRCRDPRWLVLPLWAALAAILGGVMLIDPPHFTRFVIATPAAAVLIGLGIVYIVEKLQDLPQQLGLPVQSLWTSPRLQSAPLVGIMLVVAAVNLLDYSHDYLPKHAFFGERTVYLNETAWVLQEFDLEHLKLYYLSSGSMNLQGSSLMRYQLQKRGLEYEPALVKLNELPAGDYLFVAAPERHEDLVNLAQEQLPWGQIKEYTSRYTHQPLITVLFVTLPRPLEQGY